MNTVEREIAARGGGSEDEFDRAKLNELIGAISGKPNGYDYGSEDWRRESNDIANPSVGSQLLDAITPSWGGAIGSGIGMATGIPMLGAAGSMIDAAISGEPGIGIPNESTGSGSYGLDERDESEAASPWWQGRFPDANNNGIPDIMEPPPGTGGGDDDDDDDDDPTPNPDPTIDDIIAAVRGNVMGGAGVEASRRGLNPADYNTLFGGEFDRLLGGLPTDRDTWNESMLRGAFAPDFGAQTLNREQDRMRNTYSNQLSNFAPAGFEYNMVPTTFDDPTLDKLYNENFGEATGYLDRARARGNLTDSGYNFATDALGRQGTAARSQLGEIGDALLGDYRGQLLGLNEQGRTAASGYTLGQTFDPSMYTNRLTSRVGEFGGRLEGDLRTALGDSALFDPSAVLSSAGSRQGFVNPNRPTPFAGSRERTSREERRGLGSTGAF